MVIEFSVKNFRSISNLQSISFADVARVGRNSSRFFNSVGIYGPNGSGKTNILKALNLFLEAIVQDPSSFPTLFELHQPFLFDESQNDESSFFQIIFILDNVKYRYGFTIKNFIDESNILNQEVESEWLFFFQGEDQFTIFTRKNESIIIKNKLKKSGYPKIPHKHTLFLNFIAAIDRESICFSILSNFKNFTYFNHANSNENLRIHTLRLIEDNAGGKDDIIELINNFGIFIDDIYLNEDTSIDPSTIYPLDKIDIYKDFFGKKIKLNLFKNESSGTIRIFDLAGILVKIFQKTDKPYFVILDEIDNDFHPNLVMRILDMFNNPKFNKNGSQILFSGHETYVMSNKSMSKYQFYLTEKDNFTFSTRFYSLGDFKGVTNYGDFTLKYLSGFYGGIPILKNIIEKNGTLGN